jgi:hemoglobin-like flavoprotein
MINKLYNQQLLNKSKLFYLLNAANNKKHASTAALNSSVIESVKSIFGSSNVSIVDSVRHHHSKDESLHA